MAKNPEPECPVAGRVKLAAFDFDGVFTDNTVYVGQDGNEMVRCCRSDGIGLKRLKDAGVAAVVLSAEANPVVQKRCAKLGVPCVSGCGDKLPALKEIIASRGVRASETCFVGNDLPDVECLKHVGFPVAVRGSYGELLAVARYVTKTDGGKGAVREVCDLICDSRASGRTDAPK